MAVLLALVLQQAAQGGDGLAAVDHARGVVGRVDEHHAGLLVDGFFQGVQVGLEGPGLAHDGLETAAVVGHIKAVFHEIRGKGQHLLAGIDDGAQEGIEAAGGTAGEQHVIGLQGHALLLAQMGGQLFARPGETGIGHVAESERFTGMFGKTAQALAHGGGHVRHDADDGIVPARKLLNARDVRSRDHADEHRRALALLERRGDALEHVHDHLWLHAEEDVVRLARDDLVTAHNGPDALCERLRLCLRAVGEQHLHLAASGRRARQCAAHISCADKADLHHLPCPFYTHQEPKRSPVPRTAPVFIINKGYINPRRLVKHRARQSPVP